MSAGSGIMNVLAGYPASLGRKGGREGGEGAGNESHIYPNMCAKFGCGPTVVSKRGGGVQIDRQTDKDVCSFI